MGKNLQNKRKIIMFYILRHQYLFVWDVIWMSVCIYKLIESSSLFWVIWFAIMALTPVVLRKAYYAVDEFASPAAKAEHMRKKQKERQQLKEYMKK